MCCCRLGLIFLYLNMLLYMILCVFPHLSTELVFFKSGMHLSWFCFVFFLYIKINCYQVVIFGSTSRKIWCTEKSFECRRHAQFVRLKAYKMCYMLTQQRQIHRIVRWMFSCNHGYCANYHWNDEWFDTTTENTSFGMCMCIVSRGDW